MIEDDPVPDLSEEQIAEHDACLQVVKSAIREYCRLLVASGNASLYEVAQSCDELGIELFEELSNPPEALTEPE